MSVAGFTGNQAEFNIGRTVFEPRIVRVHVAIMRDDDATVSAIALNLPGAGSCGDSEEEALAGVREAVAGVVASFAADGMDVPWIETYDIPDGVKLKWIIVNV